MMNGSVATCQTGEIRGCAHASLSALQLEDNSSCFSLATVLESILVFSTSDCIVNFFFLISYQSTVTELQVLNQHDRNYVQGFPLSQHWCWFVCVHCEVGFFISKYHGYFMLFALPSNATVVGEFHVISFSCMQQKHYIF